MDAVIYIHGKGGMVPIPGTTKTERVKENFDAVEIDLTGEEMQGIETALAGMDIVGMGR